MDVTYVPVCSDFTSPAAFTTLLLHCSLPWVALSEAHKWILVCSSLDLSLRQGGLESCQRFKPIAWKCSACQTNALPPLTSTPFTASPQPPNSLAAGWHKARNTIYLISVILSPALLTRKPNHAQPQIKLLDGAKKRPISSQKLPVA